MGIWLLPCHCGAGVRQVHDLVAKPSGEPEGIAGGLAPPFLVFPLLTLGLPVGFAAIGAPAGLPVGPLFPVLWLIVLSPLTTGGITWTYLRTRGFTTGSRVFITFTAALWTTPLAAGGVSVWLHFAGLACHGGYECPF